MLARSLRHARANALLLRFCDEASAAQLVRCPLDCLDDARAESGVGGVEVKICGGDSSISHL